MQPDSCQAGYYNLIYDKNGTVITEDKKKSGFSQPETVEAIKFWQKNGRRSNAAIKHNY